MRIKINLSFILLLLLGVSSPMISFAHGDLHERINAVSKEIKNHPDSAFLYLKRGELYFQHEEYKKSLKDYNKCNKLGFENIRLQFNFAKSYERLSNFDKALKCLQEITSSTPCHVKSHRLKGQIHLRQKSFEKAAQAFDLVLECAEGTLPENYIEASLAWENIGSDDATCRAQDALLSGIETLGPLHIFYERLINLNLKKNDLNRVIDYQNRYNQYEQ